VLQPHRHYIPLRRDLGNLDEVLHMVRDHALLEVTAARAYEDLHLSGRYSYAGLARQLDQVIEPAPRRAGWLPWPVVRVLVWTAQPLLRVQRRLPGIARRLVFFPLRIAKRTLGRILRRGRRAVAATG
jgi:hypothetical protein